MCLEKSIENLLWNIAGRKEMVKVDCAYKANFSTLIFVGFSKMLRTI